MSKTVLIIDDSKYIAEAVQEIVRMQGYQAAAATPPL